MMCLGDINYKKSNSYLSLAFFHCFLNLKFANYILAILNRKGGGKMWTKFLS